MKLNKKNILIMVVFCILSVLSITFLFQHGFNSSFFRELATDSGFDSDFGGGSSGGGGGGDYSSSSSSDYGGSGGGGGAIGPEFIIIWLILTIVVVYPIESYFNKGKESTLSLVISSLVIGFFVALMSLLPITLVIIPFFLVIFYFPNFISIPIVILLIPLSILILILIRKSIIKSMISNKQKFENSNKHVPSENCFSEVMVNPDIVNEAYDIYVHIQNAWARNDIGAMRSFLSDTMYNMYNVQIKTMIEKNQRNEMSDFKYVSGCIHDHKSYDDKDVYVITLQVLCKDYLVDATTNKVIKGSSKRINNYTYSLTFEKHKEEDIKECPNCVAPLPLYGESVKCSYCGSVINRKSTNMVLIDKKMLIQR